MPKSEFTDDMKKSKTTVDVAETPAFQHQFQAPQFDYNLGENNQWLQKLLETERRFPVQQQMPAAQSYRMPMESAAPAYSPNKASQLSALSAAPARERMVSIRKPAPYGYAKSASGAAHSVPESLLQAYLSQGWQL